MCFRSYSAFLFDAIFLSGGDNVGKNQGERAQPGCSRQLAGGGKRCERIGIVKKKKLESSGGVFAVAGSPLPSFLSHAESGGGAFADPPSPPPPMVNSLPIP